MKIHSQLTLLTSIVIDFGAFGRGSSLRYHPLISPPLPHFLDLEGGKHFFNTVREGDSVLFATEDEQDAHNWVMAFYRATGQAHKPTPPVTTGKSSSVTKAQGGKIGS